MAIFTNIVFPMLAGVFLLQCAIYFFGIRGEASHNSRYCAYFLLSFALFLIGRPVQLLSGEYPWPVVISAIRMALLGMVCVPMLLLTAGLQRFGRYRVSLRAMVVTGLILGVIYAVFRLLGTTGTYPLFKLASLTAYSSTMPLLEPPWFGREVSLAVQVVLGLILFAASLHGCIRVLRHAASPLDWRKLLLFLGVMAFGASFVVGSFVKQWAVFYVGSFVSSLIVGASVILDVYRTSHSLERSVPFLKGAILHHLSGLGGTTAGLSESFALLRKSADIDCFAILGSRSAHADQILHHAQAVIDETWRADDFLYLPLGNNTLGVAFRAEALPREIMFDAFERIARRHEEECSTSLAIGISRPCGAVEHLQTAYREALLAHEMSVRQGGSLVIHIDSVRQASTGAPFPYAEQSALISCIRLGDSVSAPAHASAYFEELKSFVGAAPGALKLRLHAAASLIVDAALSSGADAERVEGFNVQAYGGLPAMADIVSLHDWLCALSSEAAGLVAEAHKEISFSVVEKARQYLAENYPRSLTQEEVARAVAISPSYLAHLFKKECGQSFSKYLVELRLGAARKLLICSDKSITQIALDVGFSDSNYFSTVFRSKTGFSPSEFRKRNQLTEGMLSLAASTNAC